MFSQFIFWPWLAGLTFLIAGLFAVRRELAFAQRLDKLIVLGPVLYAASLAVFGAEHLAGARFIMQVVPHWMPARLFWAYFVGFALLSAAISIVLMKHVRLSATLLSVMFLLFVLLIHIPKAVATPRDRIAWAVALRDLAFGAGALSLAATRTPQGSLPSSSVLLIIARFCVAIPILFFAIEHFLHPEFAPGVPLGKLTPAWVPFGALWGYLTGAVLLAAGICLLVNKRARPATACLGLLMILLALLLYLPILAIAAQPAQMIEGLNYVADTLLFAGTVLLLAGALPAEARASAIQAAV